MSRESIIGQSASDKLLFLPPVGKTLRDRFWGTLGILHNSPPELGYRELQAMSPEQWLSLGDDQYKKLEKIIDLVKTRTNEIVHPEDNVIEKLEKLSKLNVDKDTFGKHLQTMKNLVDIYWDDIVANKLIPFGTTKNFAYACVLLHDFNRNANMNGISIAVADIASHELLALSLPGFPQDKYIHDVEYILGTKKLPKEKGNFFMYFLKLIDTFGKIPRRFVGGFFERGGQYDLWIQTQKKDKSLPVHIKDRVITAEKYRKNDKAFTMKAYDIVEKSIPGIDFVSAVVDAADMTGGR